MGIALCFLPLREEKMPAGRKVAKAFAKAWPKAPPIGEGELDGNVLVFALGPLDAILALMPAPLTGYPETSRLWPDAARDLQNHAAHLVVTVRGALPAVVLARILTQLTSALLDVTSAPGVYWQSAELLIRSDHFQEIARDRETPTPLALWVDFCLASEGAGSAGFTRGLEAFEMMELEVPVCPEEPSELYLRLFGIAEYLLENGPVIKDGDTLGESASERIAVRFSDSVFGNPSRVMRLVYD